MEDNGKKTFPGERRKHKRFDLSLVLAFQWGTKKDTLRTVDVSLGGIRIQTDTPIPIDEKLDLIILIEDGAIKPVGKVVRANPISNRMFDVGICFEDISHQCLNRLEEFLHGVTPQGDRAKPEKSLDQSILEAVESQPFELDKLKVNFLSWLSQSYPVDYQRYAHRPEIGMNEILDFLKSKGVDNLNIYYLMKSLRGG